MEGWDQWEAQTFPSQNKECSIFFSLEKEKGQENVSNYPNRPEQGLPKDGAA